MENEPNLSSESVPPPFPTRLYWCVGLLPVVPAIGCAVVQGEPFAVLVLLSIIPCSIAGGVIFGWHHRKKGIQSLGFALLVIVGLVILNTTAAFVGCTAGDAFRIH